MAYLIEEKKNHPRKHISLGLATFSHAGLMALSAIFLTISSGSAQQEDPPPKTTPDSIRTVRLGDIVITGTDGVTTPYSSEDIPLAVIARQNAVSVADLMRLIPSAHVQTNSRGETLVYLRNAGERQVGVFFDGALLNIPWDNRVDLSLIPAGVIGRMNVVLGVPPVEYGANVLGGAINLNARVTETDWSETQFSSSLGTAGRLQGSLAHRGRAGRWTYTGAVGYSRIDGMTIPGNADLPFSQSDPSLRTNTDARMANVFANASYSFRSGARVGISLLHLDAEKGIAPEAHVAPAVSRVRFWRYPLWRNTVAILSGEGTYGAKTTWKAAAWTNSFAQDIESYTSDQYQGLETVNEGSDLTFGTRFTIARLAGPGTVKVSFNGLTSTHTEHESQYNANGFTIANVTPDFSYQQHLLTLGGEYNLPVAQNFDLTVGASYETMLMPKTGDKPARDPFSDFSATIGSTYNSDDGWFFRASAGRKTRFPTLRELFGEALNRFLLNPNLTPESSILMELALGTSGERFSGEIIPFGSFTSNTIGVISVQIDPSEPPLRQRVNLRGSRVIGIELVGTAHLRHDIAVDGQIAFMHVEALQSDPTDPDKLAERPNALGRLAVSYGIGNGPTARLETVYTGRAYSLDDNNNFVTLNASWVLNSRFGYVLHVSDTHTLEMFVRGGNLTDQVVLGQLGLPGPGRTISGGMDFTL